MIPKFDKIHNRFKLDNHHFDHDDLVEVAYSLIKEGDPYEIQVGEFLLNWLDDSDTIKLKTSGSTGEPKSIRISKQIMVNSAIATGDYFGLAPGDRALLCLPARFVAGKMMLVRAIILGLELETASPASHVLFSDARPYDFCAMAPIQLKNALPRLDCFKTILVGGAPVPESVIRELQDKPTKVFESFGMTETASHIAVRPLNHIEDGHPTWFHCLPGVNVRTDDRNCLIIDAKHLSEEPIVTNDIVTVHSETEFEWLGRIDNVINSGGVKLHPEIIERKLSVHIKKRFLVAPQEDDVLGQRVVLVIEGENEQVDENIFDVLDPYEKPKAVFTIPKFVETKTNKVSREKTLALLDEPIDSMK